MSWNMLKPEQAPDTRYQLELQGLDVFKINA